MSEPEPLHPKPGDVINTRSGERRVISVTPQHSLVWVGEGRDRRLVFEYTHTALLLGPI